MPDLIDRSKLDQLQTETLQYLLDVSYCFKHEVRKKAMDMESTHRLMPHYRMSTEVIAVINTLVFDRSFTYAILNESRTSEDSE